MTKFAAYDDYAIHGMGDTPEAALDEPRAVTRDDDLSWLTVKPMTDRLAAKVQEIGGNLAFVEVDGVLDMHPDDLEGGRRRVGHASRRFGGRPMTPNDLATIGAAIYGPSWKRPLAAALGISERSIRNWMAGKYPVPEGVRRDLIELAWQRGHALLTVAQWLENEA